MSDIALILAAGRGTRMRSALAKVLHPLLGRPMVGWAVAAAQQAGFSVQVVVNHQEQEVRAALAEAGVGFARQSEPRGTGHAVLCALDALPEEGVLVVMAGDCPLLRPSTLAHLRAAHGDNLVTVLTAHLADPAEYGRVLRGPDGRPQRIVEHAEASPEIRAIHEINTGVYAFDLAWLRAVLPTFQPHPPKGEIYLTDALEAAAGRVGAVVHPDPVEVLGVNDRWALAEAKKVLRTRILREHALSGVSFDDPDSTVVEPDVRLGEDVEIGPGAILSGRTVVEDGARVGPYAIVHDSHVGVGATVHAHSVLQGARLEVGASAGPFARLRPGSVLGPRAAVGNFVELKKARFGAGAKASHLSYVGDADVGEGANIGAGTITCNYDGFQKHQTTIGAGAFIGSNTALVAPVTVGEGAIIGAGSVIVAEVPADAVAVARGEQVVREGGAARLRDRKRALKEKV